MPKAATGGVLCEKCQVLKQILFSDPRKFVKTVREHYQCLGATSQNFEALSSLNSLFIEVIELLRMARRVLRVYRQILGVDKRVLRADKRVLRVDKLVLRVGKEF